MAESVKHIEVNGVTYDIMPAVETTTTGVPVTIPSGSYGYNGKFYIITVEEDLSLEDGDRVDLVINAGEGESGGWSLDNLNAALDCGLSSACVHFEPGDTESQTKHQLIVFAEKPLEQDIQATAYITKVISGKEE